MNDTSRPVASNQPGLHSRLAETVTRHLETDFLRPIAPHSASAYRELSQELSRRPRPLVLDSFCGTGRSTAQLARAHPGHLVVGVDQSAHRLDKHIAGEQDNYMLLRANCEDIWQLLLLDGLRLEYHYLLYPNPWPKAKHLGRRIHGHGSFPRLIQLDGAIELRSNWQLYVEEFGVAMHLAGRRGLVTGVSGTPPITLFEEKYQRSGHSLWCYRSGSGSVTNSTL